MRRARLLAALLLSVAVALIQELPATAEDTLAPTADNCPTGSSTGAKASHNAYVVHSQTETSCPGPDGDQQTVSLPPGGWHTIRVCALGGLATCLQQATCADGTPETLEYYVTTTGERLYPHDSCDISTPSPTLTTGRIVEAFRRLPLPGAPLKIQPSRGWTLVNLDTIFYTTATKPLSRHIRLLGHQVQFRITERGYTWHFDDGHQIYTTTPGKPFSSIAAIKRDITHRYLLKDTYQPRVDVTYQATFRIDGGRWRPVNGTVEIQGTPKVLTARTATPHLTS